MAKIVHSLMTISRLDCGDEQLELVPVDLVDIVRVTLDHMGLLAEEKHISLRTVYRPPVYVTGDPMRLKQVVVNLVDNAIKYTPNGGEIRVSVAAEKKAACIEISDTGIGIPADSLKLVFDRFYRTDQARSRESGGTGLGLSIVKAICDVHSGVASVESIEGKGTNVRIEFPLLALTLAQADQIRTAVQLGVPPSDDVRFSDGANEVSTRH
jgi:signal transduction histidine kinase